MEVTVTDRPNNPTKSRPNEENTPQKECIAKNPKSPPRSRNSSKEDKRPNTTAKKNNNIEKNNENQSSASLTVSPTTRRNVGKYKLVRTIGKGNFAKVKLAIHMATGVEVSVYFLILPLKVAIKIIKKQNLDKGINDRVCCVISLI